MGGLRVVHYLNQFFAGVGGEEKANQPPCVTEGAIGPGQVLQRALGPEAEIVATVYCGDTYANEHTDDAVSAVTGFIDRYHPDLLVGGPAFNAGRYGLACGRVCLEAQERLEVASVTGMYPENPAVELYRGRLYIVPSGATPATMSETLARMASLGLKLARGERIGMPGEE